MKTIIAGSRTIQDYAAVERAVQESGFEITQVVSGCARGVDELGKQWGYRHDIPIANFPADWGTYGKQAGPIRNAAMAQYAEALILVWNGTSPGSRNMLEAAQKHGLKIFEFRVTTVPGQAGQKEG